MFGFWFTGLCKWTTPEIGMLVYIMFQKRCWVQYGLNLFRENFYFYSLIRNNFGPHLQCENWVRKQMRKIVCIVTGEAFLSFGVIFVIPSLEIFKNFPTIFYFLGQDTLTSPECRPNYILTSCFWEIKLSFFMTNWNNWG